MDKKPQQQRPGAAQPSKQPQKQNPSTTKNPAQKK